MNNEHSPRQIVPTVVGPEVRAMTSTGEDIFDDITQGDCKYGFVTDVHTETTPEGLNEEVVCLISAKKEELEWLLESRPRVYRHWFTLERLDWMHLSILEIDY